MFYVSWHGVLQSTLTSKHMARRLVGPWMYCTRKIRLEESAINKEDQIQVIIDKLFFRFLFLFLAGKDICSPRNI